MPIIYVEIKPESNKMTGSILIVANQIVYQNYVHVSMNVTQNLHGYDAILYCNNPQGFSKNIYAIQRCKAINVYCFPVYISLQNFKYILCNIK